MGGKNKIIRNYFIYDSKKNQQICMKCKTVLSGDVASNMVRHIRATHKTTFLLYHQQLQNSNKAKVCTLKNLQTFKIKHSEEDIWQGCIELVTRGGVPFSFISHSGFKKIIGPVISEMNCHDSSLNESNLTNRLNKYAKTIKDSITEVVRGKTVSLIIDSATRLDSSILGINVQYVEDDELVIKSLAMKVVTQSCTSVYLKNVILESLKDYNIGLNQVYCITSDNGRNMIRATKLINDEYDEDIDIELGCEELAANYVDLEAIENLLLTEANNNPIINCTRSAAHTLQLVVTDVIKCSDLEDKLKEVRKTVIELRKPINLEVLKSRNLNVPVLNVPTRWNSSFNMAKRILELKLFIEDDENKISSKPDFQFIEQFIDSFQEVTGATIKLQSSKVTIQDSYKIWLELKVNLQDKPNYYSKCILEHIERWECTLLNTSVMSAGIFLDPRFHFLLSNEQSLAAKNHLKMLYNHSVKYSDLSSATASLSASSSPSSTTSFIDSEEEFANADLPQTSKLASYLSNLENNEMQKTEESQLLKAYREIDNYSPTRMAPEIDLMHYWKLYKNNFPMLYQLSRAIFSTPATQVSAERTFSTLKFLLCENRNKLPNQNLDNLLLVRLNFDFD